MCSAGFPVTAPAQTASPEIRLFHREAGQIRPCGLRAKTFAFFVAVGAARPSPPSPEPLASAGRSRLGGGTARLRAAKKRHAQSEDQEPLRQDSSIVLHRALFDSDIRPPLGLSRVHLVDARTRRRPRGMPRTLRRSGPEPSFTIGVGRRFLGVVATEAGGRRRPLRACTTRGGGVCTASRSVGSGEDVRRRRCGTSGSRAGRRESGSR